MAGGNAEKGQPLLRRLAWDSEHFGFPVARVTTPDRDDAGLEEPLAEARREAIRLVYWPACRGREAPGDLLRKFAGLLTDRRATFIASDLAPGPRLDPKAEPVRVSEYTRAEP